MYSPTILIKLFVYKYEKFETIHMKSAVRKEKPVVVLMNFLGASLLYLG